MSFVAESVTNDMMCKTEGVSGDPSGLRKRTRSAVQAEISEAAQRLFLLHGYEATTIEDVAVEAGISPRSVYRYFPAKDDLLIGRFSDASAKVIEVLRSRPAAEHPWVSLRAAFTPLVEHADAQPDTEAARRIHRTIFNSPALMGRYLQHMHLAELAAWDVLNARRRSPRTRVGDADDDGLALLAVIAAAFGSLIAAQHVWSTQTGDTPVADLLDQAMTAVKHAELRP
ncbi:TetR/AcrR family transcriptional regulator [soil metagenome]